MMMFRKNGIRTIDLKFSEASITEVKKAFQSFLESKAINKKNSTKGRGIVICAGGIGYTTCAWININILRDKGCKLPIEVWYLGTELSKAMIAQFKKLGVKCKNFLNYCDVKTNGYSLKPLAIVLSSFSEVLYLDADNICVKDPTYLFDDVIYKEYGCLFWKDFWRTSKDNPIWNIINNNDYHEQEQESGQILVNKKRNWKELNLCLYFNINSQIYYKLLHGDKDTFKFAWSALKSKYFMVEKHPGICGFFDKHGEFIGNTIVQFDTQDQILFLHRNLIKWDVTLLHEKNWQYIKSFNSIGRESIHDLKYRPLDGCYSLNIEGDVNTQLFTEALNDLEKICLSLLKRLRNENFYRDFMTHCHFRDKRFYNNVEFN